MQISVERVAPQASLMTIFTRASGARIPAFSALGRLAFVRVARVDPLLPLLMITMVNATNSVQSVPSSTTRPQLAKSASRLVESAAKRTPV